MTRIEELTKCSFACACKKVRPCATFERAHLAELYVSLCRVRQVEVDRHLVILSSKNQDSGDQNLRIDKTRCVWCKAFDKFQTSCPDIKHVDGQNFTALVSRATTVRQKGRLCMVLRSCANIIVRQRPSEIEAVKAEAMRLKIAIPKQMLSQLTTLERGEASQEQAEDG